jgi:prophage tail gpP-like protein
MSKVIVNNVTTRQELLWRSIKIKKSLDEICHSLELEIPPAELSKVRKHHRLEVRCRNKLVNDSGGERRVTTVLVDEITATSDTDKHTLTVIARSPARDIIDSTWSNWGDDFYYNDRTLREITRYIGNKFNIVCDTFPTDKPDPTSSILFFTFENESPWTKLIDEADQQGFIFTSNEAGNLYLWPVQGSVSEPFNITEGENVKNIKWTENGSEQFNKYIVKGGWHDSVVKIDNTCPGNRILTIEIDDPFVTLTEVERRAETEMRRRRENKTIVNVAGWGLTDDQIIRLGDTNKREIYWVPNTLIPVKVPSLGLNANLLISEVEYSATPETMSCDITLVNREMYL